MSTDIGRVGQLVALDGGPVTRRSPGRLQRDLARLVGPIDAEQGRQRNQLRHASSLILVLASLESHACSGSGERLIADLGQRSAPEDSLGPKHALGSKRSVYSSRRRTRSFVAERCVYQREMACIDSVAQVRHTSFDQARPIISHGARDFSFAHPQRCA